MNRSKNKLALAEIATGILISICLCLFFILISHRLSPMHSYRDLFFSYWTQYVCCLLALWAVWTLIIAWRTSASRIRCLKSFEIPQPNAMTTEADVEALISRFSESGRSCHDDLISTETSRLVDQVKGLNEISILIPLLDSQRRRVTDILMSEFASVRVLCWSIPVVGLIGTTLALGEAVSGFSAFLAAGDHAPEDVRRALALAESNLAAASEPLVLSILLTAGISALWSLTAHKQKEIVGGLEDICRAFIVALSGWQTSRPEPRARMSEPASDATSEVAAIRATLQSVRSEISELSPALRRLSETLRNSEDVPHARSASAG